MSSRLNMFRLRLLQVLILLAPLPFGSAPEPFATLFYLLLVMWVALSWPLAREAIPLPGSQWLGRLVLILPGLALVQTLPLPRGMVEFLNPGVLKILASLPGGGEGHWLTLSLAPGITFAAALNMLVLALFFLTLLRLPLGPGEAGGITAALLLSGAVQTLIGSLRMLLPRGDFFLFFYPVHNVQPWSTLTGTFADSGQAALFLGMVLLAGLGFWAAEAGVFSSRAPRHVSFKEWLLPGSISGWHFVLMGGCAAGFALTRNKNQFWLMAGSGTVLFLLWLFTQFTPDYRHRLRWIFLAAVLMAAAMGISRNQPRFQEQRTGVPVFVDVAPAAIEMIGDFPFWGSGWGTFSRINPLYINRPEIHFSHARNEWLEVATEGGLLSLGLLISALLLYLWGVWRRWSECPDRWIRAASAGLLGAVLLFWGTGFAHYPLRVPSLIFPALLLMALAARLLADRELEK